MGLLDRVREAWRRRAAPPGPSPGSETVPGTPVAPTDPAGPQVPEAAAPPAPPPDPEDDAPSR